MAIRYVIIFRGDLGYDFSHPKGCNSEASTRISSVPSLGFFSFLRSETILLIPEETYHQITAHVKKELTIMRKKNIS
jgi:hypothetical protein